MIPELQTAEPLSPTVTLLIPTLNEEVGMRVIMPRVDPAWVNQILVVDGQSTDGTVALAREQGYEVVIQQRRGIRHAYIEALPFVRGDITVTFSPDGNCVPEVIPELLTKMHEGYDMVVASRYFGGMRSEDDDLITRFGNWLFTWSINSLHGGHYTDSMGIYRAWRTNLFWELDLDGEAGYYPEKLLRTVIGVEPLLSIRAAKANLRIAEVAGPEPPRIGGERKLQILGWGGAYMLQVLRETFYWDPRRRSDAAARWRASRTSAAGTDGGAPWGVRP